MEPKDPNELSLTAGQKSVPGELQHLEAIIEAARPKPKERALALLEIHDRRLYLSEYVSFSNYLWKRWQIRRSRGYQLLNWARLLRAKAGCTVNERQARRSKDQSKEHDWTLRVMDQITKAWETLPPAKRSDFIKDIRSLLKEFEQELGHASNPQETVVGHD